MPRTAPAAADFDTTDSDPPALAEEGLVLVAV
jgi:hypothetical protein